MRQRQQPSQGKRSENMGTGAVSLAPEPGCRTRSLKQEYWQEKVDALEDE